MVDNGAIGGNSPLNSDKIYQKLYEYSDFKNTGITTNVDNSKYLCSWLWYNPQYPEQSKWLDRYYNPDKASKVDALSEEWWIQLSELSSFSLTQTLNEPYESYYKEFRKGVIKKEEMAKKIKVSLLELFQVYRNFINTITDLFGIEIFSSAGQASIAYKDLAEFAVYINDPEFSTKIREN